jgi:hypothetical protein
LEGECWQSHFAIEIEVMTTSQQQLVDYTKKQKRQEKVYQEQLTLMLRLTGREAKLSSDGGRASCNVLRHHTTNVNDHKVQMHGSGKEQEISTNSQRF